ncbi:MAG: SMI1/KNR4 family protein [Myxococcales bacterium]|nr:SMI1/KNR4 family protein [Myxococcales bacterium]
MAPHALDERLERALRRIALLRDADRSNPPYARLVFGAQEHGYDLPGAATEQELEAFEREHGVELPVDYRAWLARVSNGGAGPYYGLRALHDAVEERELMPQHHVVARDSEGNELARAGTSPRPVLDRPSQVGRPFPFEAPWSPLDDGFSLPDDTNPYDGSLVLADQGCGMLSLLVVSGTHRGEVWSDSTASEGGFSPEAPSFLDWVEAWLERALVEWVTKSAPRFVASAPLPGAVTEALPFVEAAAKAGHEESWAALAYLHARDGRTEQALAAAEEMARVADAEPERRRAVVRAAIFRAAGDVDQWLAEAERGLAIEKGWASSRTALLRERVRAMRVKKHPGLDDAIEALAAHDVWSLDAQLDCARSRVRRGDIPGAIRRLDETLHQTGVMLRTPVERLENAFLPLVDSLERDGEPAAAAVRAALEERIARAR